MIINIKMKEHYKMPIFWKVAEWIKHLCGRWEVESTPFLTKLLETNLQKTPSTHSSLEFSCTVSLKRGEEKVFCTKKLPENKDSYCKSDYYLFTRIHCMRGISAQWWGQEGKCPKWDISNRPRAVILSVQMNVTAGTGSFPWDYWSF